MAPSECGTWFHPGLHQWSSLYPRAVLFSSILKHARIQSSFPVKKKQYVSVYIYHSEVIAWSDLTLIFHFSPLTAMSIYMLLVFEVETGIASVCVLSSGVLVLLLIVTHSLIRAAHTAKRFRREHTHTMYHNDPEHSLGIHTSNISITEKPSRQHSLANLQRHFINPAHIDPKSQYSPSNGPHIHSSDKDGYSGGGSGRTHRTLSTESGLFHAQAKPWNGVNSEMRSILARKATIKDSTLVWIVSHGYI